VNGSEAQRRAEADYDGRLCTQAMPRQHESYREHAAHRRKGAGHDGRPRGSVEAAGQMIREVRHETRHVQIGAELEDVRSSRTRPPAGYRAWPLRC
jgi:hypothetical protein